MPDSTMLKWALYYRNKLHYSIIPANKDKKPLIKSEEYQTRLATEDEIRAWWGKTPDANIGIVTGLISGIAVVDIDTAEGKEAIQQYLPDSLSCPTAETPRGGQHLYFKCTDPKLTNNARTIPGCDLRANGGYVIAPPSRNGTGRGYRWTVKPSDVPPPPLPQAYLEAVKSPRESHNESQIVTTSHKLFQKGKRDDDLFHIANALAKSRISQTEIAQVIEILALNCNPPFSVAEAQKKVQSALSRAESRDTNLAAEVRDWVRVTTGHWKVTDYYNESQIVTKSDKHAVCVELSRLVKAGVIERHKTEHGKYRRIEAEAEAIDWQNVGEETVDIQWPFDLQQYAITMPKNIIVIAGSPNAGKTAFLLNVVEKNMDRFRINYFSSEMGPKELRVRLKKFERPLDSWRFNAFERSGNFEDCIAPDDINIVDYIELSDAFYQISGTLKAIFDRLNKGIAIVAIQKKPGAQAGYGGVFSLEKPRLYLTLDTTNILTIVKAKNWADEMYNPNGLSCKYLLHKGAKFQMASEWTKEGR